MTGKSRLWLLRRRIFRETPALVRLDSSCCAMERYCESGGRGLGACHGQVD
jgi:hypothetical protein